MQKPYRTIKIRPHATIQEKIFYDDFKIRLNKYEFKIKFKFIIPIQNVPNLSFTVVNQLPGLYSWLVRFLKQYI